MTPSERAELERLRELLSQDIEQAESRLQVIKLQQRWYIVDRLLGAPQKVV